MKKLLSVVLVLLMGLCFLTGCGEEEPVKTSFKQGETATFDDVSYTVTKVKRSKGSEWESPKKGHEYVIVTLKIENKSDDVIAYNTFDWKMENSKGQLDGETFSTVNSDSALNSGDLKSGGTKKGTLVFEEPKKDKKLKLHYYGSMLNDESQFHFVLNK